MGGKISKKIGKILLWIVASFIALDFLLVGLLFVPAIQTFAVNKLTQSISEKWGSEISLKDVYVTPTLKVVAHDFRIQDDHHNDMIFVGTVKGRLNGLSITPLKLKFGKVHLDNADVVLRTYAGEDKVNIAIWAKKIRKKETPKLFLLTAKNLQLTNTRFVLINDDKRVVYNTNDTPDIDYAYFELKDINWDTDQFKVEHLKYTSIEAKFKKLAFSQYGGFNMTDGSGDFSICDTSLVFNKLKIRTPNSALDLDLKFDYSYWSRLGDFLDSVQIKANIRPSLLCMKDVAGFAPAIKGMDEKFFLQSDRVQGCVNDFKLINFHAGWGLFTRLNGDLAFKDITDFKHAYFNVQLDSSTVCVPDLANFTLPGGKTLPKNKTLTKIGTTGLNLSFTGTTTDFNADVRARSAVGSASVLLSSFVDSDGGIQFHGNVASPDLNLAALTGKPKVLGSSNFNFDIDGNMLSSELNAENFKTLSAHIDGDIHQIQIYGYPLKNTSLSGDYKNRQYDGDVSISDPHFDCDIIGQLDITNTLPTLQGNITLNQFDVSDIAKRIPAVDSAKATGFNKVVYAAQQSSNVKIAFDNFMVTLKGNSLDNVNGYIGCDNIQYQNEDEEISNKRLRLTAINTEQFHKFILASSILNASLETTYPVSKTLDSLKDFAQDYFPDLLHQSNQTINIDKDKHLAQNGYVKAHVTTYNTRNIVKLFYPDLFIAQNSTIDVEIGSALEKSTIKANIPFFGIRNKFNIRDLTVDGENIDDQRLAISLHSDSVMVYAGQTRVPFDNLTLDTKTNHDIIQYNVQWHNRFNQSSLHDSHLSGKVCLDNLKDIAINVTNSAIYLNDHLWFFNPDNNIRIQPNAILLDDVVFSDEHNCGISADGIYSKKQQGDLRLKVSDMDMALANPLLSSMQFGGILSADFNLRSRKGKVITFGKALINDFQFNQDSIGDVFVLAALDTLGKIGFTGGIFQEEKLLSSQSLQEFDVRRFLMEDVKTAKITGQYVSDKRELAVHTSFDTLNAGFVGTFLSGFSNYFDGNASGTLSFYSTPDSSYFDGTVHANDISMGITPLGTRYFVQDQDIFFNSKGIFFKDMLIKDPDGNTAYMSGRILHQLFKNMLIDLNIHTDRVQVLNTPKDATSVFYGTGYAAGDVSINGDEHAIHFTGPNLKTLQGTKITLQVSSANSASQSNIIQFKPKPTTSQKDLDNQTKESSKSSALYMDFTFDVDNESDIALILESIGGTMNARADGRFQLTYNDKDNDLNLFGNLQIHSGDFKLALYNVINSRLTLVPGGSIRFDGPLEEMTVNASAYKTSKTSLSNIIPTEYASGNATMVNAYLHLNGPLMKQIEPTFSFELPNNNEEFRNLFYNAIDTSNTENMTKQFAYFLLTNNFMSNDIFTSNGGGFQISSFFRNIVNNMLSTLMENQKGSFGITYNQETETSAAEYGVTANASLLKDRMTLETSIGYYDDNTRSAANNMYGDFTLQYNLNKSGTWKVKAYTYIGERNEEYYMHDNQINYVAGVALAFKQDFNGKKKYKSAGKKNKVEKNEKH